MTRLLQVLVTVTLLCPSLCRDDCQDDTTSLVQIKSMVSPGNRRFNDRDAHSEDWQSETEDDPMIDDDSMLADDPSVSQSPYHYANRLGNTLFGPNAPVHTAHIFFAPAKKRREARRSAADQRPTYGLTDNYAGMNGAAPQTNALDSSGLQEDDPSDFTTDMLGQESPTDAFSRSEAMPKKAVSDSSMGSSMDVTRMVAPEDQAFVANEIAKGEAFIHKRAADAKAYQDKVQAEKNEFAKREAFTKALVDDQKNAETKYFEDQKAQIKAYLMKQQSAYNAYDQAQKMGAAKIMNARKSVQMAMRP